MICIRRHVIPDKKTVETVTVNAKGFRGPAELAQRRAIAGPFFAAPPVVEHFTLLAKLA